MPCDANRDASILGCATLRDVESAHYLQPRDHRGLDGFRDRGQLACHAVDARADEELLGLRLEMNVGCAVVERTPDHLIHEPDRGCHIADPSRMSRTTP